MAELNGEAAPIQRRCIAVRRITLAMLFGTFSLFLAIQTHGQPPKRPNVLLIYLDDFGWRDCGFMGSDFYETPHLDQLASQGMVFTQAYSCAANCAPARACLLSGQYTPRHEIYNVGTRLRGNPKFSKLKHIPGTDTLRRDLQTWAHCIQRAGYATGIIGKWHLSQDPVPYGFDFNCAGTHSGSPPKGYFPPHPGAPGLEDASPDEYLTDRLNDEALAFIEGHQDRAWMLYLSHFAVHTPLQARPDLLAKYEQKPPGDLHSTSVMGAMIQSVDDGVGKIVHKLKELGLYENTIILFTSDNGGYGPATTMRPLKGYKGTYYEGGIREPFFVTWPGVVAAGSRCEVPIIQVDIFPTLLEMTGAEAPANQIQDGHSLLPLLTGQGGFPERALFWHFPAYLEGYSRIDEQRDPIFRTRPCSIIREGNWKLHEYFEDGGLELYNLAEDVSESKNLLTQYPQRAQQMHAKLVAWREQLRAPVPSQLNPEYDPDAENAAKERLLRQSKKSPPGGKQ
ncbi:MAG: sulfatase [bacterium]|nr:sulfatase [bacterium]